MRRRALKKSPLRAPSQADSRSLPIRFQPLRRAYLPPPKRGTVLRRRPGGTSLATPYDSRTWKGKPRSWRHAAPGCRPTVPSIGESEPFGRIRSTERRSAMQEQNRSLSIVSSLAVVGLLLLVALAAGIAIANAAEI